MEKANTKTCSASITIFLALTLTLIISVILSTVESSRRIAVSAYLEGVTALSMDSVFSEYCIQLWEDYHVFSVITNNDDFMTNLTYYIKNNLTLKNNLYTSNGSFFKSKLINITINDFSNITDDYGEIFIHQVLSYMQYKEISNIADYLLTDSKVEYDPTELTKLSDGELSSESIEALNIEPLVEMVDDANKNLANTDYESDMELSETFTLDSLKNISHIFNEMLIHYVIESPSDISYKHFDSGGFPSRYMSIDKDFKPTKFQELDRFLICEYANGCFSSYTTNVKESALDYQLEYLLHGYRSDENNLVETARELVLLRFGYNVMHILMDSDKMSTLTSIAETTAIIPALPIIVETILVILWALSESVIDVKDLLEGKLVPLIKTSNDWTLSIENLLDFDYETNSKNSGETGLSYNNYIEMLLFTRDMNTTSIRMMDLIQLDISTNINDTFVMSNCYVGASCQFQFSSMDAFASSNFYHKTYFAPVYTFTHNYYYR